MTTTRVMIKCPWLAEIDGSATEPLSEERLGELSAHVEQCAVCRRFLEAGGDSEGLESLATDLRAAARVREEAAVDVTAPVEKLNELLVGYRIEGELGRGGMGVVYKAWQVELSRHVALKVLPALLGAVRPDAMARFRREAALAASLKHSNIIGVYDFGEVDGTLYYAMELVEGRSLRDLIQEMRAAGGMEAALRIVASATDLTPSPAASRLGDSSGVTSRGMGPAAEFFRKITGWVADIAEALHYAHEHGVVHRDIKPANLLLSRAGRLMICDFGLARSIMTGADARTLTLTRTLVGTSRYMSPECVDESLGPVDRRADVYALGATLYELLTLRPIFAAEDDREILHRVLNTEPVRPRAVVRQVPHELEVICLKALAKRPRERYESGQAFADDLRRWLLGLPILARRPTLTIRVGNFVRRRKAVSALTGALVVALVAGSVLGVRTVSDSRRSALAAAEITDQRVKLLWGESAAAFRDRKYAEVVALLDQALQLKPGDVALRTERAQSARFIEGEAAAASILEALCIEAPARWQAHYYLTMLYRDWKGAPTGKLEEHAEAVRRLMPDTPEAYYVRALAERDDRAAIALLDKAFELDPGRLEVVLQRVVRYAAIGDHEARLRDADRAVAISPRAPFAHSDRGNALLDLHRFEEAVQAFSRAIELQPERATHWHNRSVAQSGAGRFDQAVSDATRAIELDPNLGAAYLVRARGQAGRGAFDAALGDADRGVTLDPRNANVYIERSTLYQQLGRWEDMLADCTRAIEIAPDDPQAYGNRVFALAALGRFERALPDIQRLVLLRPNDPNCHLGRAELMIHLHRFDDAAASVTRVIEIDDRNGDVYNKRGLLGLLAGHPERAVFDFTRAFELKPTQGVYLLERAAAYAAMGKPDLALEDLDKLDEAGDIAPRQYAALSRHLILAETDRTPESRAALGAVEGLRNQTWPGRLIDYFAGGSSERALLDAAANDDERAEAHYYLGMHRLIQGRRPEAEASFQECVRLDRLTVFETVLAHCRLIGLSRESAGKPAPADSADPPK